MATILSIADIIEIGQVSTYLSANYTSKQALFGGSVIKTTPPVQIAFVTDALDWGNSGGAQTAESLRSTANYLYWLCGLFQLQAQNIINGPGGGSVTPIPGGGTLPSPYDYEVGASTPPLSNGESSVTLTSFIGYNIAFNRNNIPQSTVNLGGSYYSWNRTTGLFSISGAAVTGELFQIIPIG
jgi:hypothetical protein